MTPMRKLLYGLLAISLLFLAFCGIAAFGPERELRFSRNLPIQTPRVQLERIFNDPQQWPVWFQSVAEARLEDPARGLTAGQTVLLSVDPRKGPSKIFTLKLKILRFEPSRSLSLELLEDSSGRLTRLFKKLIWSVEIQNQSSKPILHGEASATAIHWRSKVFGSFAERILLYQSYYFNLLKLADLNRMDSTNPFDPQPPRR